MPSPSKWYRDHSLWLEAFVIVNLAFLTLDRELQIPESFAERGLTARSTAFAR